MRRAPPSPLVRFGTAFHLVFSLLAARAIHRRIQSLAPRAPLVGIALEALWAGSIVAALAELCGAFRERPRP